MLTCIVVILDWATFVERGKFARSLGSIEDTCHLHSTSKEVSAEMEVSLTQSPTQQWEFYLKALEPLEDYVAQCLHQLIAARSIDGTPDIPLSLSSVHALVEYVRLFGSMTQGRQESHFNLAELLFVSEPSRGLGSN